MNILNQLSGKINGKFAMFDRIVINGYLLSLINTNSFSYYVHLNGINIKDFKSFATKQTKELCEHIEAYIKNNDCISQYLTSTKINKDVLEKNPNKSGLIIAFSDVESCKIITVSNNKDTKQLEYVSRSTKCKHYYLYYNDDIFGLMFVRIQTWFPYNVEIYFNGHDYMSKVFDKENIKYEMYNNSFSYIDDYDRAQKLADNFLNKKLSGALENLVSKINIHYQKIKELNNDSYYYCVNQCEFAVDYSFNSCEDLNLIYKKLAETAFYTLKCDNVYSFFGRNIKYINRTKNVDLTSNLKNWDQGYRIKFKLNKNQVKMYNKGNNLRIEVTINNPKASKVLKDLPNDITCDNDDNNKVNKKKFVPMGKSISNFYRYAEVSKSIIDRFVDSLPMLDIEENVPKEDIQKISERTTVNERNYSAFNLLNRDNITLFSVISDGKYLIHGFTNKSIILEVFDEASKRNINKLTRLLAKLRAFGIIKKIDHRNTYFLTDFGRRICNSILLYVNKDLLGF